MFPKRKRFRLWLLFGLFIGLAILGAAGRTAAAPSATLTLGTTVISEGDDFATTELAQPWDMDSGPYPDYTTMLKNFKRNKFSQSGGMYHLEGTNTDPRVWLHWTGIDNTQKVLKMGDQYPIDANKYRLLSFYLCMDQVVPDYTWGSNVYWFYDRSSHDDPANGISNYIYWKTEGLYQTANQCNLVVFDLKKLGTYNGAWNNSPRKPMGLRLDINNKPADYDLAWVRLTTRDLNNIVPMTWSGAPSGQQKFYMSMTGCGQDGILVGTSSGTSGTFNWGDQIQDQGKEKFPLPLPESFEPDSYHVYMKSSNGSISCANSELEVKAAPRFEILQPSRISGPDYATEVANNAWGMDSPTDMENLVGVQNVTYNNGILKATTTQSDPRFFLNVVGSINASKYKYVTFRMYVPGEQSIVNGWVQRFHWWYQSVNDAVSTEDMVIYEGWHNYTIDLSTAPLTSSGSWSGNPKTFRFDPLETPGGSVVNLDYMTLTAEQSVTQGNTYPVIYNPLGGGSTTVTFSYDNDTNASNGFSPALEFQQAASELAWAFGVHTVFMPIIRMPDEIPINGLTYLWNTSSVAKGEYYIVATITDGINTTTWYSESPVTVK
jgi:hypothetical protein